MSSNIRRRGGVYWFRRRVPKELRTRFPSGELSHSLKTTSPREAACRARSAWLETEELFTTMSLHADLTAAQAKVLLQRLATEPLFDSPTADELVADAAGDDWSSLRALFSASTVDIIMSLPEEARVAVGQHMFLLSERVEASVARTAVSASRLATGLQTLRTERERQRADDAEAAVLQGHRADKVAVEVADRLKELAVRVVPATPLVAVQPSVAAIPATGPLFSTVAEEFVRSKNFAADALSQRRSTLRYWAEIVGDRATSTYTRRDVMSFREALRALPASHGKGTPRTAPAAIQAAAGQDVDRLSEKTIKRHFSLLRQFWKYLGDEAADQRIWLDIEHKVEDNGRLNWSTENLDRLLRARWNPTNRAGNRVSEETHAWLVALAAYTGCRLEELARIKVAEVVTRPDGVVAFKVAPEIVARPNRRRVTKNTPKTAASVREVPVHPKLLEAGFLELVEDRKLAGAEFLLDLEASGKGGKRGVEYSRNFSTHKAKAGVGPDNVFHSFRHSVETILASKEVKQQWVDWFLGHMSERKGEKKSVGEKVYLHGVEMECIAFTAYQVEYPAAVEPTLLLQRVRGVVPW